MTKPIFTTLISVDELFSHLDDPEWLIIDNRYDLQDPSWGLKEYMISHIPGAVFADLEKDICGPETESTGKHPLPEPMAFHSFIQRIDLGQSQQVVVYDQSNGAMASRLWWMLRFCGHHQVAVLDGGYQAWKDAIFPVNLTIRPHQNNSFCCHPDNSLQITAADMEEWRQDFQYLVVDSRSPERYRGEIEPFYSKAGHIPGAKNRFYGLNIGPEGKFLARNALKEQFQQLLENRCPENVAFYCGSGVTATHNVLAMEYAGFSGSKLYIGSWSEWIKDPKHGIATGND